MQHGCALSGVKNCIIRFGCRRCLASVGPFKSELLVMDSGLSGSNRQMLESIGSDEFTSVNKETVHFTGDLALGPLGMEKMVSYNLLSRTCAIACWDVVGDSYMSRSVRALRKLPW